jgi:hypothetical protein
LHWETVDPRGKFSDFRLALMEIRIVIALLVWWFDAEFVEEGQKEPYYKDLVAAVHGPLRLRIRPLARN